LKTLLFFYSLPGKASISRVSFAISGSLEFSMMCRQK